MATTTAPAVLPDKRERWLAARREMIGASDVPAILGVDVRSGPLAIYAQKVSDKADPADRAWMKFGRRVEGAIADWYADETGREAADLGGCEIQRHPDLPFLGATLDRLTAGNEAHPDPLGKPCSRTTANAAPLEAKAVAGFKAHEWRDDPPLPAVVQVQIQMACTGAQWGSLAALLGGVSFVWRDLLRDDAFLAAAYPRLEAFWLRVQRREPPEADALPGTSEAIRRLWSDADGETVTLDQEAAELVTAWESAKSGIGTQKDTADEKENKLRVLLGSASFGRLPDGSVLTLKVTKRAGYSVEPCEYRTLRRWFPRLLRRGR